MRRTGGRLGWVAAALLWAVSAAAAEPLQKFLALGTASPSGVYYPVGKGLCGLINAGRKEHLVRCLSYATGGSLYNVQALASGQLDLAITNADLLYQAHRGSDAFKSIGPNPDLRLVSLLYHQPVAVVVRKGGGIERWEQLPGHRINIGNLGAGKRTVAEMLLAASGWGKGRFKEVLELDTDEMGEAFCAGKVDILIHAMGLPAPFYDHIARDCGGRFLEIPEALIEKILADHPYMERDQIPGGLYPNNPREVATVGMATVLATMARVPAATIERVAAALFDDLAALRAVNPALARADRGLLESNGGGVPQHEGVRHYLEAGSSGR